MVSAKSIGIGIAVLLVIGGIIAVIVWAVSHHSADVDATDGNGDSPAAPPATAPPAAPPATPPTTAPPPALSVDAQTAKSTMLASVEMKVGRHLTTDELAIFDRVYQP